LTAVGGGGALLDLPAHSRGMVRVKLDAPGYYWFSCPVGNHATRGMLGLVLVKGEVPDAETGEQLWRYRHAIPLDLPLCCGNVGAVP
jgi:PQQ system protein